MEMRKLMNFIHRRIESSKPIGNEQCTKVQGMIIAFLGSHKEKDVFQKDIETKFSMRRSTTSTMLKSMEEKGFIERISSEKDARVKKLQLSETGKSMVEEVNSEIQRIEKLLTNGLTEEEMDQFFEIIQKMQQNMSEAQVKAETEDK
ncbi:MAG: MarR family transcriptional regulator [Carnobacterium inhibens]|uniref:MarR family winged helix-turn-helix transcriptional regulator n=1 Tax=Carnobacterium TaxID=2747 RepID=UPI000689ADE7|nr:MULTISPECIES: MarR family transcriptional regulator [Carnobacterium]